MKKQFLRKIDAKDFKPKISEPLDRDTLAAAKAIVDDVENRGEPALREHAERFGDIEPGASLTIGRADMKNALDELDRGDRELLERTAERIERFAKAQLASLKTMEIPIPGGAAGHDMAPVMRAGCYAPGGRFPLPSSVLMTALTAKAAGVSEIWVASPKPKPITLAAAAIAQADGFLAVGGAQAVAALAFGAGVVPACDIVVGPGNRFVTAAKKLVFGRAAVDMLAGPSELTVLADETADPSIIAIDLLAQAEHDPDALPLLVTTDASLIDAVNSAIERRIRELPTAKTALSALANGFAVFAPDMGTAVRICNALAPEHLEIHIGNSAQVKGELTDYGALFIGSHSAEVLGDYGAGPNHTLPTGKTSRYTGGLCVFDFLRVRTWLRIDDPKQARELITDAERLAELEGLAAHAQAARARR